MDWLSTLLVHTVLCVYSCHPLLSHPLQSLKEFNLSSYHYKRCHELQPSFAAALSQHKSAICEMRILQLLDNHARDLDLARNKLDELYRKHEEMQKHQEVDGWYPHKRYGEDVDHTYTTGSYCTCGVIRSQSFEMRIRTYIE